MLINVHRPPSLTTASKSLGKGERLKNEYQFIYTSNKV